MKKILSTFLGLTLLALVGFIFTTRVDASEITSYTNSTNLTVDGSTVSSATSVNAGTTITATNSVSFDDSVSIAEGDTLTLTLPNELAFVSGQTFDVADSDVYDKAGVKIGTATIDRSSKTLTVTFTDQFTKEPLNKTLELTVLLHIDSSVVTESGPVTTTYQGTQYSLNYNASNAGEIDSYTFKYGYQNESGYIEWFMVVNGAQDPITNMVISDTIGEGQEMVTNSLRIVRLQYVANDPVDSDAEARSRFVHDNHTAEAEVTPTGFTLSRNNNSGDGYGWAYVISYRTKITDEAATTGTSFTNTLNLSGDNFAGRTRTATYVMQEAYGSGRSNQVAASSSSTEASSSSEESTSASSTDPSASTSASSADAKAAAQTSKSSKKNKSSKTNGLPSTGEKFAPYLTVAGFIILALAALIAIRRPQSEK
ncbi:collagen binding domain-containing protein [Streptococcus dentiloxodontae]